MDYMSSMRWTVVVGTVVFLVAFGNMPTLFAIAGTSGVLETMFSGGLFWKWFVVITHSAAMWWVMGSTIWAITPPPMWHRFWHAPKTERNER